MIQRSEWFSREFSFDLPVWMFPNILERLRGTPARIEDRVLQLSPETLTTRIDDKWSIQENVGHLLDLEPLWMGRVEDFVSGMDVLRPADLTNAATHQANHNAKRIQEIATAFRSARSDLMHVLETCDEATVLHTALHPRLETEMRVPDLAFFVAEHDDHPLARISELIDRLGE